MSCWKNENAGGIRQWEDLDLVSYCGRIGTRRLVACRTVPGTCVIGTGTGTSGACGEYVRVPGRSNSSYRELAHMTNPIQSDPIRYPIRPRERKQRECRNATTAR